MEHSALVVEDDADIRGLIEHTLSAKGFTVTTAVDGREGIAKARELAPDLVTLDIGLPELDGIEVCRRIREFSDAYIIMVSARADEVDRLIGLQIGADDYLTKPFSPRELGVRATTLLRRPRRAGAAPTDAAPAPAAGAVPAPEETNEVLEHGPVRVDVDAREAWVDGEELTLTRTEFDLLAVLMGRPSVVWSRETLLRLVWGSDWGDTHLVEVHMGNLRKKLGGTGQKLIRTVRGVGYRMEAATG